MGETTNTDDARKMFADMHSKCLKALDICAELDEERAEKNRLKKFCEEFVWVEGTDSGHSYIEGLLGDIDSKFKLISECQHKLIKARDAIEQMPQDALGEATEDVADEFGQHGQLRWPIRDELINSLNETIRRTSIEMAKKQDR